MALTLIKEDGTGLATANAYADVSDSDSYHEGHLYATAWTAATADDKAKALAMASRVLDASYHFHGKRLKEDQSLQWPRLECPDPDDAGDGLLPSNAVPRVLQDAACEFARELLITDRTAAHPGEGIIATWTDTGGTKYAKFDKRPTVPHLVQAMLGKFGALVKERSGSARLVRT